MKYKHLKKRIKKNEGFSKKPYKDQLGNLTIGYGHLIKKKETYFFKKSISKKKLDSLFESDFNKAVYDYKNNFLKYKLNRLEEELLIEMIFQLGIKNVLGFKKMITNIINKKNYLAALEMMNSLWYKQTPGRVENLIKNYLKQ